jgi:hypothetical protein
VGQLIERTANTLDTHGALERYQGHFYNWYDTRSLKPLLPMYMSTVDSGNLAGHLLTLQAGLTGLAASPCSAAPGGGLVTTATLLQQAWREQYGAMAGELARAAGSARWNGWRAAAPLAVAPAAVAGRAGPAGGAHGETLLWHTALLQQCRAALAELALLMPWLALPAEALPDSALLRMPSLRELAALYDSVNSVQQSAGTSRT